MSFDLFAHGPATPPPELVLDQETTIFYGGSTYLGKGATSVVYPCLLRRKSFGVASVCEAAMRIAAAETKDEKETLQKETENWSNIPKHDNLLKLLAYKIQKETSRTPFVFYSVSERLDGDLENLIFKNSDFAEECTFGSFLKIFQDICQGLIHLHQHSAVHNDLKPQNVVVAMGRQGHVVCSKVAAFGASKTLEFSRGSGSSSFKGTWDFIAPEVLCAPVFHEEKVRSQVSVDVYSLGVLMWVALNRAKVHENPRRTGEVGREITWGKVGAKKQVWCGAPSELCDLIESCLQYSDDEDVSSDYGRPTPAEVLEQLRGMDDNAWAEDRVLAYEGGPPTQSGVRTEATAGAAGAAGAVAGAVSAGGGDAVQQQIEDLKETIESLKASQRGMSTAVKTMLGGQQEVVQMVEGMKGVLTLVRMRTMLSDKHKDRIDQALLTSAKDGDLNDVVELLDRGATIESSDTIGNSPLLLAAKGGHLTTVEALISHGAEINARNKDNDTPLIWATIGGHLDIVQSLISAGADKAAKNNNMKSAMDLAGDYERAAVLETLQQEVA